MSQWYTTLLSVISVVLSKQDQTAYWDGIREKYGENEKILAAPSTKAKTAG